MDAFFQWLLANRCYLDLLVIGVVIALGIAANILEQADDDLSDLHTGFGTNESTDGDA